jgi:hypothetical protein
MIRSLVVLVLCFGLAPSAHSQSSAPLLALWEFDGWPPPTPERPLGLRFALLEDGRVLYAPDDPAMDVLIPNQYFQARLSPEEMLVLTKALHEALPKSTAASRKEGSRTVFYLRDPATGAERQAELAGHPCLAKGRVFSATAPVAGLDAVQNSIDRAALPRAVRDACNLLTGFHHASTTPWSSHTVPALLPEMITR